MRRQSVNLLKQIVKINTYTLKFFLKKQYRHSHALTLFFPLKIQVQPLFFVWNSFFILKNNQVFYIIRNSILIHKEWMPCRKEKTHATIESTAREFEAGKQIHWRGSCRFLYFLLASTCQARIHFFFLLFIFYFFKYKNSEWVNFLLNFFL